jgi:MFS family permease
MCAFASFGGIFFGYDSGYINGVNGSKYFIEQVEGMGAKALSESHQSLIVSILSCGTFFGALIAGDLADRMGRKWTVIMGCAIYCIGVVIQMITGHGDPLACIVVGRLIAGLGVGFESAIVILYMSEIVSYTLSTSASLPLLTASLLVPQECSWCSRRRLPILYHHRSPPRRLHRLRN